MSTCGGALTTYSFYSRKLVFSYGKTQPRVPLNCGRHGLAIDLCEATHELPEGVNLRPHTGRLFYCLGILFEKTESFMEGFVLILGQRDDALLGA